MPRPDLMLSAIAGGYLRNPVRAARTTSIHPLRGLVADRAKGIEVPLVAAAGVQQPRAINPDHFTCDSRLPRGSHVLLIDDTWATGGHVQSAVLALRRAGAARVSALVVARWIKGNYGDNKSFIAGLADRDYNPLICPWTGGGCPETLVELVVDFIGLRA